MLQAPFDAQPPTEIASTSVLIGAQKGAVPVTATVDLSDTQQPPAATFVVVAALFFDAQQAVSPPALSFLSHAKAVFEATVEIGVGFDVQHPLAVEFTVDASV